MGRGARPVPVRPYEVRVESEKEQRERACQPKPERGKNIQKSPRKFSRGPVEEEKPDAGDNGEDREVLAQEPPVVPPENARDVRPGEHAIVDDRMKPDEGEGGEKRDLRDAELTPDALPSEVERDRYGEQHGLDPREAGGAEGEAGEGARDRGAVFLHEEEEEERRREQELHDDLGIGKTREPDLDLKNGQERRSEDRDLETEDPPEPEKEARDRHEREERGGVEPGFGLIERGGRCDPDRIEVKAVRNDAGALRGLEAKPLVSKVVPSGKRFVGKEQRARFGRNARHHRIGIDEASVPGEVKTRVDVDPGIAAPEDVLERRKINHRGKRNDCGGGEELRS